MPPKEIKPEKSREQLKQEHFLAEYHILCKKHNLAITSVLSYTLLGLVPKLEIVEYKAK